ncbi:HHL221Wp [Eremothecium sinecaudum]|uniref:HHL221Wp n=1 Tax=Eremothecium sinecaudum TaxID=45286 RepID=A0A0X8HW17_9SACH|nr:HHL221Wp [Eremothecium sinecaudum]AMD22549.1 HHL221Wp [Eremothecium sinecaudum]
MGRSQPYIYLRPWNVLGKRSSNPMASNVGNSVASQRIAAKDNHMLRIDLRKFPSFLGHCSSRINRRMNEDAYSMQMLKFPKSSEEVACINSKRITNRSQHWAKQLEFDKSVLNISIFDGHGGDRVSQLLSKKLHEWLVTTYPSKRAFDNVLKSYWKIVGGEYWKSIYETRNQFYERFIKSCNTKEELVLQDSEMSGSRMIFDKWGNLIDKTSLLNEYDRLRFYLAYLKHDLEDICGFKTTEESDKYAGGSTASSIFLTTYNEEQSYDESFVINPEILFKLVITQVGDTKIILCDKNGIAHPLAKTHNPSSTRESRRLGGHFQTDSFGDTRFLDSFANTRAFGDRAGKSQGLTCEPDIYSYVIGSTRLLPKSEHSKLQFGGDECFVCLVTDGVSDLMSDQELVDLITSTVNNRGLKVASPQYCTEEVIRYLMAIGGKHADNATCLILRLPNWGNWPVIDRTGAIREEKLMTS